MDRYVCEFAKEEDLLEIAKIEDEFFSEYFEKYDLELIKKWYLHNPGMFLVVRDTTESSIVGFTFTVPITDEAYNKLISGETHDMADFSDSDILQNSDSKYYYFADICLSKKRISGNVNRSFAYLAMMKGVAENLNSTPVEHIVSTSITPEGLTAAKSMGFEVAREYTLPGYDKPVWTTVLNATPELKKELLDGLTKRRERLVAMVKKRFEGK